MVTERTHWPAVTSVAAASLVLVLSEFIAVAVLPEVADRFGVSEGTAGLAVVLPGLLAAICAPLLTVLTSRWDRRQVLLALTAAIVVADGISALAPNFALFLLGRAVLGMTVGAFWTIGAGIGPRLVPDAQVTRATSLITAGISAGTVISLPAGRAIADGLGERWVFGLAALVAALVLLIQLAVLPAMPARESVGWRTLTGLLARPSARTGLLVAALLFAAHFAAYTYITPFLTGPSGMSGDAVSGLLLLFGITGLVGNFTAGSLVNRFLPATLVGAAALLALVTLTLAALHGTSAVVVAAVAVWGIAWGAIPLGVQTYMMKVGGSDGSLALFVSTTQVSLALGSVVGGRLVDRFGLPTDYVVAAVPALLAGCAILALFPSAKPESNGLGSSAGYAAPAGSGR